MADIINLASARRWRLEKILGGSGVDVLEDGGIRMAEGSDIADLLRVCSLMRSRWPDCSDSSAGSVAKGLDDQSEQVVF